MATDTPASDLPWTGERYVPQIKGEIELEHVHRYLWAAQFSLGKRVLDIACGEGYGSEILARSAAHVVGVDLSEDAVIHASRKYSLKNLEFLTGSCDRIPVSEGEIDLVVSFETIEHHDRHQEMMREIKRILSPEGILIISSPDKYVYSDVPGYRNEYHVKELYARDFDALLKEHFANVQMFGQRVAYGSIIAGEGEAGFVSFDSEQKSPPAMRGVERAIYNLAIASDSTLPETFDSIYERNVTKSVGYQALQQAHAEVRREVEALQQAHAEAKGEVEALQQAHAEANNLRAALVRDLDVYRREVELRDSKLSSAKRELAELSLAKRQVEARDSKLAQLNKADSKLREELSKFRQGLSKAEKEIGRLKADRLQMESSLSWRMTWPFRMVRDQLASAVWRARKAFPKGISKGSPQVAVATEDPKRASIAPLFDEEYYKALHPKSATSGRPAIEHYLESGWKEGFKPHPLFDPTWYLKENPDIAEAGVEPLYHYVTAGWREGRNPHPLFDVRYYLNQAPKLVESDIEPLAHFLKHGAREGRRPHPLFDPAWYAGFNRHSMAPGENPLTHYVTRGWKEGCDSHPSFNISLYLKANPEVRGEDPLAHYLRQSRIGSVHLMPDIRSEPPDANTDPPEVDVKAIALYLPQFHRIPENDLWWGEGFTEWTNVRRGRPQFWGHYQPHVPHPDIGYYDLSDPSVMEKQAKMARQFGIHGFCFYYYWFNGRRLLEMPTDRLLASGKPDFPFCFCWANENWTRRWDGQEHEVIMGQQHSHESDERFIQDILPALRDRRYIRINGRPLLAVYRPGLLPNPKATFAHWREVCRHEGLGEIYLAGFKAFDLEDPESFGMDAAVEFPPHHCKVEKSDRKEFPLFNDFDGTIYDYQRVAENLLNHPTGKSVLFRGIMPSWDNSARRQKQGTIWVHSHPQLYCRWLHRAALQTRRHPNPDERLIFINSWNEWAEGAHLEPEERYGYAWLNATRLALETGSFRRRAAFNSDEPYVLVISHDAALAGAQRVTISLLREWKRRMPFTVRVICVGDGELRRDFEKCFPTLVLSDYPAKTDRDRALIEFLKGSPRVIYSSTVVNGPLLAELRPLGAKIVTHVHELQKSIERWAPGEIMVATLKYSDFFVACSDRVAENLSVAHGVPEERQSVLYEFIELWGKEHEPTVASRTAMREELSVEVGDVLAFGSGTTDWRKGPDLFVEIARLACSRDARLKFVWIGGDPAPLMEKVRSAGLEGRVLFLGHRRGARCYFYVGDVFLLSSREDPCPLVALEAANSGLPIVCFAGAGDIPVFVGEECGAVVPYEDVVAAAQAVLRLAGDAEVRHTQGAEGRKRVIERHSSASAAVKIEALFDRLAQEPQPTTRRAKQRAQEPLVSVIVPNYNHEKYLSERLRSITAQTYQNMEIILLDDASTDGSRAILEKFSSEESRARFVPNTQNSGSTFRQWRKGLSQARGKYVWIAESDDAAEPMFLETLVGKLEANAGLSLACCQLQMVSPNGEALGTPDGWLSEIDPLRWKDNFVNDGIDEIRRSLVVKNTILNASGVVFRNAEGLADLVDISMRLCADWLFWVRLLRRGGIAYVAEPLSRWRLNSSNARTRPPGELEWLEGERVLTEAAQILKFTPHEWDRILLDFMRKCWKWRIESVPQEREPVSKEIRRISDSPRTHDLLNLPSLQGDKDTKNGKLERHSQKLERIMLPQDEWFEAICESYSNPPVVIDGKELPAFPSDIIQTNTTGQAGANTLKEAFVFYQGCIETFKSLGAAIEPQHRLLDFGVGWGRIARFFLRELPIENIYGIDIVEEFVQICRQTFRSDNFKVTTPFPPTQLPSEGFNFIVGYSVFSHLSEEACASWMKEFSRILSPGGILALTTRGRPFFDFCESLREKGHDGYLGALSKIFDDFDHARSRYDRGEFIHSNREGVNGGGAMTAGFYGETFIPEKYARSAYADHFALEEFLFEPALQSHPTMFFRKL
ncbi:MAG TPA: glycoside hydrolase family 99-like domain-containing protein [Terrimicrobiaceae bacterium]